MACSPLPLLASLAATSLALAACDSGRSQGCPGQAIAALALHGDLETAASGCASPPAGGWSPPATLPAGDPTGTYHAVFAWDETSQRLAYCAGGAHAAVLYGTRSGDHLRAEVTLPAAVLAACASSCSPLMTVVVEGDLDTGATPVTFTGTLTETFDGGGGPCGGCVLPCTPTYRLTGTGR